MASRHELHDELKVLLGSSNVYFQPPESIKMKYPCYVYHREAPDVIHADNKLYRRVHKYGLIYITLDPDDSLIDGTVDHFAMCRFGRFYAADGLNHYYYDLYY